MKRARPFRAALFCAALFCAPLFGAAPAQTSGAAAPPAPSRPSFPRAFAENHAGPRGTLTRDILPDLRVWVDLDPKDMPRNLVQGELPAAEVREAVALGIGNWASVLPGMRFRMVPSPDSANLVVRFRDYGSHISGGATAEAFLPSEWRPAPPAPGAFDFACGAVVPGRMPDGSPCRETGNNIILFQSRGVAFRRIDTVDARMHHAFLAALADRRDPGKRFYRFLPDPRYRVWTAENPPDRSTCAAGAARGDTLPALDIVCPQDSDWTALPHGRTFGHAFGPFDIARMAQHEFGHALLGAHTGERGCLAKTPEDYLDYGRDPVFREASAVRRAGPGGAWGFSILFSGNGMDATWNSRGLFALDAARLAGGALGPDCAAAGEWKGYPTSYPRSSMWIVLRDRGGGIKYVDDWDYAARLMGWPVAGPGAPPAEWFQVGLLPK